MIIDINVKLDTDKPTDSEVAELIVRLLTELNEKLEDR